MIKIIPPSEFKNIPWKNGQGMTIELAINDGGSMTSFDWRISSAAVNEDGFFSDFSGYSRHLILLEGKGILLEHDLAAVDRLDSFLDIASFDGKNKTYGRLLDGPITDLNLITNSSKYHAEVKVCDQCELNPINDLCFIYSPRNDAQLKNLNTEQELILIAKHLMQISFPEKTEAYTLSGESLIVIKLTRKNLI